MCASSHGLDRVDVDFDDDHAVADAGLVLAATSRSTSGWKPRPRTGRVGYRPGRKTLTLVHALLAGVDCIDDADILRADRPGGSWAMT